MDCEARAPAATAVRATAAPATARHSAGAATGPAWAPTHGAQGPSPSPRVAVGASAFRFRRR